LAALLWHGQHDGKRKGQKCLFGGNIISKLEARGKFQIIGDNNITTRKNDGNSILSFLSTSCFIF